MRRSTYHAGTDFDLLVGCKKLQMQMAQLTILSQYNQRRLQMARGGVLMIDAACHLLSDLHPRDPGRLVMHFFAILFAAFAFPHYFCSNKSFTGL